MITVRDNGPGIAPEDQEWIFESFQQGRRAASREEGTGLGLTLCRRIVALLGGRLWLESEVGRGSAFHVALPLDAAPADVVSDEPVDRSGGQQTVIVMIDDDRSSLELLSAYLAGTGLKIVRARDGLEGLEEIRREQPAAVILDIRLPGMDGWAVLDTLRSQDATRDIPVIIVSILDEKSRGLALGAIGYLTKPVSRDDSARGPARGQGVGLMSRARVLVVEDNPLNLKLVRDVLGHAGFDVLEARTGEDGVARARADQPAVILMDLQLPGLDGTQALRLIKADPATAAIPVVALTAFAMAEDRERALSHGFDGYLSKPISVRDLPGQVAGYLTDAA